MPQHNSFAFRVKACSDAHVTLAPNIGIDYYEIYYDIVISGWNNEITMIRQVYHPISHT